MYIYSDGLQPIDLESLRKYGMGSNIGATSGELFIGSIENCVIKEAKKSVPFNVGVSTDIDRRIVEYGKKHFEPLSQKPEQAVIEKRRERPNIFITRETVKSTKTTVEYTFIWEHLDVPRALPFGGKYYAGALLIPEATPSLKKMVAQYKSRVKSLGAQRGLFIKVNTEGGCKFLNKTLHYKALLGKPPTWTICIKPIPSKATRLNDFKTTLAAEVLVGIPKNTIIPFRDNRTDGGTKAVDYPAIVRPIVALLGQKNPDFTNILGYLRSGGPFVRLHYDVVRIPVTDITADRTDKLFGVIPFKRKQTTEFRRDVKLTKHALINSIIELNQDEDIGEKDVTFVIGPLIDEEIAFLRDTTGISNELYFFNQGTPAIWHQNKMYIEFNIVRWHPFQYEEIMENLNVEMPSSDELEGFIQKNSPQFHEAWKLAAKLNEVDENKLIRSW